MPGLLVASLELDIICDGISDDLTTIRSNGKPTDHLLSYLCPTQYCIVLQILYFMNIPANSIVSGEVARPHRHAAWALRTPRPDVSQI